MQPINTQEFHQSNYVNVLNRLLDLAMQTAEAASREKNHRLVLQAVREATRLVSLITKITSPQAQKPKLQPGAQTEKWEKSGKKVGKIGALEEFFKKNLPVGSYTKNSPSGSPAGPSGNAIKPHNRAAGAIRWQDEPVTLAAEENAA